MKYLLLNILFLSTLLHSNESMQLIDVKIKDIDKQREGVTKKLLSKIKNPFYLPPIIVEKVEENTTVIEAEVVEVVPAVEEKKVLAPLDLDLIINKSALINNKWYHIGDDVEGYKILNIQLDYIVVDQYGERVRLNMQDKNENIHFKRVKQDLQKKENTL